MPLHNRADSMHCQETPTQTRSSCMSVYEAAVASLQPHRLWAEHTQRTAGVWTPTTAIVTLKLSGPDDKIVVIGLGERSCLDGVEVQVLLELAADMMVMVLSFQYQGKVPHLKPWYTSAS